MLDPFMLTILGVLLALVFFAYLLLRRTVLGFREGIEQGRDDK